MHYASNFSGLQLLAVGFPMCNILVHMHLSVGDTLIGVTIFFEALIPVLLCAVAHMYTFYYQSFFYRCIFFCKLTLFALLYVSVLPRRFSFSCL